MCDLMDPNLETAATKLKASSIPIGRIKVPKDSNINKKFDFLNYPHLLVFKSGVPFIYKGGRQSEGKFGF